MRNGRAREAWQLTRTGNGWRWQLLGAASVVAVSYAVLVELFPAGEVPSNLILNSATIAAPLVLVPLLEFGYRYVELARPLRDVRAVIADYRAGDQRQPMHLNQALEKRGKTLSPLHFTALVSLDAEGDDLRVSPTYTLSGHGKLVLSDVHVEIIKPS